ncbi:MAG TPA: hypothetical protein VGS07_27015 [Thermoanaerobaculia bacterium]|jgi:hypothetical protein|nr:hypothetical protein [Thermoanaerobaculia bacterium]
MSDIKVNAVEWVRQIRDRIYEETKDMSHKELIAYYRRHGAKAKEKLNQLQGRT